MKELETKRLKLRKVTEADTQAIFDNWASDPEVTRYMTWNPHKSVEHTRMIMDYWLSEYGKPDCYRWVLVPKGESDPIGMIDVVSIDEEGHPVIGYCESKRYWGRGLMTEALQAVMELLLEDGSEELRISAVDDNKASNRVIQKAGFTYLESKNVPMSPVKPDMVTLNTYFLRKGDRK